MLSLQAGINARVDPNWVQARYPYLRAVAVETAEAMEHHGWKWWKQQQPDLPQLQMELVDIWHFILSEVLLRSRDKDADPQAILLEYLTEAESQSSIEMDGKRYLLARMDLLSKLELLMGLALLRRIHLAVFTSIMQDCELDWAELFRQYVGKNVLNRFRQDRGYQDGNYQKLWQGREDNACLVDIIHRLDPDRADFQSAVYRELVSAYPEQ